MLQNNKHSSLRHCLELCFLQVIMWCLLLQFCSCFLMHWIAFQGLPGALPFSQQAPPVVPILTPGTAFRDVPEPTPGVILSHCQYLFS